MCTSAQPSPAHTQTHTTYNFHASVVHDSQQHTAPLKLHHSIVMPALLLHPFNGLFSRTTWVSRHQKGKPLWILMKQEMMGWQWHQLNHMQIICTSFQTYNYLSISSFNVLWAGCPSCHPTNSVKALKAQPALPVASNSSSQVKHWFCTGEHSYTASILQIFNQPLWHEKFQLSALCIGQWTHWSVWSTWQQTKTDVEHDNICNEQQTYCCLLYLRSWHRGT